MSIDAILIAGIRIESLPKMTVLSSGLPGRDNTDPCFAEFVRYAQTHGLMSKPGMRRDFFFRNDVMGGYEFVVAVEDGFMAMPPHVVKAFPGGLYAILSCSSDIVQKVTLLQETIASSGCFSADVSGDPFRCSILSHLITPKHVQEGVGFEQMDLFLPIIKRQRCRFIVEAGCPKV